MSYFWYVGRKSDLKAAVSCVRKSWEAELVNLFVACQVVSNVCTHWILHNIGNKIVPSCMKCPVNWDFHCVHYMYGILLIHKNQVL